MKDIKGYEGLYAITEEGMVWSYRRKKFLKPSLNVSYLKVHLYKDGECKTKTIHRLVLETFKPVVGMENLQANHIDENKQNNNLSNLEWTTAKENTLHSSYKWKGRKGKVIPVEQYSLDGRLVAVYSSQAEAARELGINRYSISDCLRGRTHTGGGYIWRFIDEGEESKENISC